LHSHTLSYTLIHSHTLSYTLIHTLIPPYLSSKVVVVSQTFEGMSLIQRHRAVNHSLGDMLKNDIHALSIQAKTPAQWSADSTVGSTPNCLGGDK